MAIRVFRYGTFVKINILYVEYECLENICYIYPGLFEIVHKKAVCMWLAVAVGWLWYLTAVNTTSGEAS